MLKEGEGQRLITAIWRKQFDERRFLAQDAYKDYLAASEDYLAKLSEMQIRFAETGEDWAVGFGNALLTGTVVICSRLADDAFITVTQNNLSL